MLAANTVKANVLWQLAMRLAQQHSWLAIIMAYPWQRCVLVNLCCSQHSATDALGWLL
jgi:hypothetical protein